MINRYKRSDFYPKTSVDGVAERDLLMSKFNDYTFKKAFVSYVLQYEDYLRPDLMSKRIYGTKDYWWIILRCNPGLDDIWNDFGYSNETITVSASEIDPSINIENDYMVVVDKQEYLYPNAFKVGNIINIPTLTDIQDFYTFAMK